MNLAPGGPAPPKGVAGVVLGAGGGRRFGRRKQLARLRTTRRSHSVFASGVKLRGEVS
jgi:CTP:molybdopterin cytidylyltransferase MocA